MSLVSVKRVGKSGGKVEYVISTSSDKSNKDRWVSRIDGCG